MLSRPIPLLHVALWAGSLLLPGSFGSNLGSDTPSSVSQHPTKVPEGSVDIMASSVVAWSSESYKLPLEMNPLPAPAVVEQCMMAFTKCTAGLLANPGNPQPYLAGGVKPSSDASSPTAAPSLSLNGVSSSPEKPASSDISPGTDSSIIGQGPASSGSLTSTAPWQSVNWVPNSSGQPASSLDTPPGTESSRTGQTPGQTPGLSDAATPSSSSTGVPTSPAASADISRGSLSVTPSPTGSFTTSGSSRFTTKPTTQTLTHQANSVSSSAMSATSVDSFGVAWVCPSASPKSLQENEHFDCSAGWVSRTVVPGVANTVLGAAYAAATSHGGNIGRVHVVNKTEHQDGGDDIKKWGFASIPVDGDDWDPCTTNFEVPQGHNKYELTTLHVGPVSIEKCQYDTKARKLRCPGFKDVQCHDSKMKRPEYSCSDGQTVSPTAMCTLRWEYLLTEQDSNHQ
ncbi:hypothetical protein N7512_001702 [Penicillium capsulatum]|nr:hypothetical protein N7512_001702 [Penicillium capsulatum]